MDIVYNLNNTTRCKLLGRQVDSYVGAHLGARNLVTFTSRAHRHWECLEGITDVGGYWTAATCGVSTEHLDQGPLREVNLVGLGLARNKGSSRRGTLHSTAAIVLLRGFRMVLSSKLRSSI